MDAADTTTSIFSFVALQEFQNLFNLPKDFGLAQFYPQPSEIATNSEQLKAALDCIRQELLDTLPKEAPTGGWIEICLILQIRFRQLLNEMSQNIRPDPAAVENAVVALSEVCQRFVSALLDAQTGIRELKQFSEIFSEWRQESIHITEQTINFFHGSEEWKIKPVEYAFGRLGFCVEMQGGTYPSFVRVG
jgi:hypothetical protein